MTKTPPLRRFEIVKGDVFVWPMGWGEATWIHAELLLEDLDTHHNIQQRTGPRLTVLNSDKLADYDEWGRFWAKQIQEAKEINQ